MGVSGFMFPVMALLAQTVFACLPDRAGEQSASGVRDAGMTGFSIPAQWPFG